MAPLWSYRVTYGPQWPFIDLYGTPQTSSVPLHSSKFLYGSLHPCMALYKFLLLLYATLQPSNFLYTTLQTSTVLYSPLHSSTLLYSPTMVPLWPLFRAKRVIEVC